MLSRRVCQEDLSKYGIKNNPIFVLEECEPLRPTLSLFMCVYADVIPRRLLRTRTCTRTYARTSYLAVAVFKHTINK